MRIYTPPNESEKFKTKKHGFCRAFYYVLIFNYASKPSKDGISIEPEPPSISKSISNLTSF